MSSALKAASAAARFAHHWHDVTRLDAAGFVDSAAAGRALAQDYQRMVEDGLLLDDAEPFVVLLQRCQALADKVNAAVRGPS